MTDAAEPRAASRLETLQRMLDKIPLGSTIRAPEPRPAPTREPLLMSVDYKPPAVGAYPCKSGCGAACSQPGVCATCAMKGAREEAFAMFAKSLSSLPETFRWACPGSPDLTRRTSPLGANGVPFSPRYLVEGMAQALVLEGRLAYVLWGPTEAGKTSIACAVARCIVDQAVDELVTRPQAPPADRLAPLPALPMIVRIASGIRFVRTIDLSPPRDRGSDAEPPAFGLAQRASILILDDGSKESSSAEGSWSDAARALAVVEVIAKRWDRGRPTIFTTFLDAAGVGKRYDGGTRRRLFDDNRSRAIEFRGPEGAKK